MIGTDNWACKSGAQERSGHMIYIWKPCEWIKLPKEQEERRDCGPEECTDFIWRFGRGKVKERD